MKIAEQFASFINKLSKDEYLKIIENLQRGFEKESLDEINRFIERKDYILKHNFLELNKLFSDTEIKEQKECSKALNAARKKFQKFNIEDYKLEVFYGLSGLRWLPQNIQNKIKGGIFLDIGAFVGDSSIALADAFEPEKVYAFEPEKNNFQTLSNNAKIETKIIPVKLAISDKKGEVFISQSKSESQISNVNKGGEKVITETIDNFVRENGISRVSLIKMDIEGEEMRALEGAKETIAKYKPVLAISVYHKAEDFFFIKPWIEENFPGYTFIFKKTHPFDLGQESVILGYSKII